MKKDTYQLVIDVPIKSERITARISPVERLMVNLVIRDIRRGTAAPYTDADMIRSAIRKMYVDFYSEDDPLDFCNNE